MCPTVKANVKQRVGEELVLSLRRICSFTIVSTGLCLWQSWYLRGFQNTLMDCVAEEDFYAELLDRFTVSPANAPGVGCFLPSCAWHWFKRAPTLRPMPS